MQVFESTVQTIPVGREVGWKIGNPDSVVSYLRDAVDRWPMQESFWVICLNLKMRPTGRGLVTLGTLTASLVHPREVYRMAILSAAARVIVAHSHPSGDPAPSQEDVQVTRWLRDAGNLLGIKLEDHVIIGNADADPKGVGYYSFREAGLCL